MRGLLLHKLLEEVLTGELVEEVGRFATAPASLIAELVLDPDNDRLPDADEIAAVAWRTLQLPDIAALRERLVAEWPVYALLEGRSNRAHSPGASMPSPTPEIAPRWSLTGKATSIRPTRIFASMPVSSKIISGRQVRREARSSI